MNDQERAAMQQALEGLNRAQAELRGITPTQDFSEAADALRAALAQQPEPAQEPVAVPWQGGLTNDELLREWSFRLPGVTPTDRELSAFAIGIEAGYKVVWMQRPPLTDEEIAEATAGVLGLPHEIKVELARAIERKVRGE